MCAVQPNIAATIIIIIIIWVKPYSEKEEYTEFFSISVHINNFL